MSKISELSLTKIVNGIKKKDFTSEEVTKSFIDNSRKSKKLNTYITDCFDEALKLWVDAGISKDRIFKFGASDNWWGPPIHGDEGPCGPCSELHYDFGEKKGCLVPNCKPNCETLMKSGEKCTRFVELWNLVFMQYEQVSKDKRIDLPKPSVDTGMGLERMAALLQGLSLIHI